MKTHEKPFENPMSDCATAVRSKYFGKGKSNSEKWWMQNRRERTMLAGSSGTTARVAGKGLTPKKFVSLLHKRLCSACQGHGEWGASGSTCNRCAGSGWEP